MTNPIPKTPQFGPWLRGVREHLGVSQVELARRTGISNNTISKIERGVFGPAWDTVWKLAKGLGLSLGDLDHMTSSS